MPGRPYPIQTFRITILKQTSSHLVEKEFIITSNQQKPSRKLRYIILKAFVEDLLMNIKQSMGTEKKNRNLRQSTLCALVSQLLQCCGFSFSYSWMVWIRNRLKSYFLTIRCWRHKATISRTMFRCSEWIIHHSRQTNWNWSKMSQMCDLSESTFAAITGYAAWL